MTYEEYLAAEAEHEALVRRVERSYSARASAEAAESFKRIQALRTRYPEFDTRRTETES